MFDPACEFLLPMPTDNLFEAVGTAASHTVRCKGCQRTLNRWERERHHRGHVRGQKKVAAARLAAAKQARAANLAKARKAAAEARKLRGAAKT